MSYWRRWSIRSPGARGRLGGIGKAEQLPALGGPEVSSLQASWLCSPFVRHNLFILSLNCFLKREGHSGTGGEVPSLGVFLSFSVSVPLFLSLFLFSSFSLSVSLSLKLCIEFWKLLTYAVISIFEIQAKEK